MTWDELAESVSDMPPARRKEPVYLVDDRDGGDGSAGPTATPVDVVRAAFDVCVGGHFTLDNWPVVLEGEYHLVDDAGPTTWDELAAVIPDMPADERAKNVPCILGFDSADRRAVPVAAEEASEVVRDAEGNVALRTGDWHLR